VRTHCSAAVRAPCTGLRALGLAGLLLALCAPQASAQARNAAIRVNVTVLDLEDSDVLGARAMPAASAHDDWRITSGRRTELSLFAEHVGAGAVARRADWVAICEVVDAAATNCREHLLPALRAQGARRTPDLVVRVRPGRSASTAPVRLTLAYTGM
jgi:type IV pilus biogenesis protein CpaD/CtpE